ncbi:phosphoribosyltransferase family protein [Sandarakinorhabdus sp.]|uniref:phosphoribosyltransferase n=1 Tax=Sandarakinorhabdus sp. TaxID=1916663 RepID=UPI00286D7F67|nr:phosphoribosyltransferase family protein [Sandarakinorhabdus sp.]
MTDIAKIWLTADDLLGDSFRLARQVLESGFRPTHLVGIWRGGAPIGIAVQEFFDVHGVDCDHIAIRTASYTGIGSQAKTVKVYALGYLIDTLNVGDRLLVIDDVFDSGRSIEAVLTELKARCRANTPADIRIATVWYKPARNQTALKPEYFIHESNDWLVFPHEIDGLTTAEIRAHKPAADVILTPIEGLTK